MPITDAQSHQVRNDEFPSIVFECTRIPQKSTHVQVPLFAGKEKWGEVEIAFRELENGGSFLGVPETLFALFLLLGAWLGVLAILCCSCLRQ